MQTRGTVILAIGACLHTILPSTAEKSAIAGVAVLSEAIHACRAECASVVACNTIRARLTLFLHEGASCGARGDGENSHSVR